MNDTDFTLVSPATIIDDNHWSFHQDLTFVKDSSLILSIKNFGILHPPIVRERNRNFELICGRKRLAAARITEPERPLLCRVVTASAANEYLLKIAFEDQRLTGPLSAIMKARFLSLCENLLPDGIISKIIGDTDISYGQLKRVLPLLSLELPIRNAIHNGKVSEKVGFDFLQLMQEDRLFLTDLFERLSLNNNKQRRLIEMCRIIMAQESLTLEELFSTHFKDFLHSHEKENIPQVVNNLLKRLFEKSHPQACNAEKQFSEQVKNLKLPANYTVEHSPSFERDNVSLLIGFKDINELAEQLGNSDLIVHKKL